MAALQCEICGGKLVGKPGGLFECEYCGMEYNTDWAKAKIQEIKGTVKVEGTVDVKGTVKVEGGVTVQSLCQKGFFDLENGNYSTASDAFNRALDIDLEWGDAYMGLIMCKYALFVKTKDEFRKRMLRHEFDNEPYFQKFLQTSGSTEHREMVEAYRQQLDNERIIVEENRCRGREKIDYYRNLRQKYYPVRGRITRDCTYALDSDNKLVQAKIGAMFTGETPWTDMVWIGQMHCGHREPVLMGIYADGTAIAEDNSQRVEIFEPEDHVTEICAWGAYGSQYFLGLQKDGSLITSFCNPYVEKKKIFNDCKAKWQGKKVETLCEVNRDEYAEENLLRVIGQGDEIVWAETDTDRMTAQLHANGTVTLLRSGHPTLDAQVNLWNDIIQVVSSRSTVVGLKCDGTVLYAYPYETMRSPSTERNFSDVRDEVQQWENIVFIRVVRDGVLGVTRDGRIRTANGYDFGMGNMITNFRLFDSIDTLADNIAKRRAEAYAQWRNGISKWSYNQDEKEEKIVIEEQRRYLQSQVDAIHAEMATLKGIFAIKRRRELEDRMGRLLLEMEKLDS